MTNRVVLGNTPGGYGLRVSKPGYDVLTTSSENLLFDSSVSFYRVRATYDFTFPPAGSTPQTQTINHGYNSVPLVCWSIRNSSQTGGWNVGLTIYTTATQLIVYAQGTGTATYYARVHLLTDTL